ncbi:Methyltransferase [Granulibacter bethesdensis]|nr:Methyltransferase [Granulibacter bethesdensis CGDNIH4]AHJ67470.1 Methyltransferase [Granulibacter bethesdensis]APH58762.1 Methyltransferase [Granulibacter bethesdensis]
MGFVNRMRRMEKLPDMQQAAAFYGTLAGEVVASLLRARLRLLWPGEECEGQTLLGLGHAAPYMRCWRSTAYRCVVGSLHPSAGQVWPPAGRTLSCDATPSALPFPDLSIDRIVLVHALEMTDHARGLLREVWRILKDDGRLMVVAPNRTGLWAHLDTNPFGQGQPFSHGQIERLLAASLFRVERRDAALYMPPVFHSRALLRAAWLFESTGRHLIPGLAGVTISEAVKDVYAGVPLRPTIRKRLMVQDAAEHLVSQKAFTPVSHPSTTSDCGVASPDRSSVGNS